MANPTIIDSGTITVAAVGTEETVDSQTAAATYVFAVDHSNLAADEYVELKTKKKVLSGGDLEIVEVETRNWASSEKVWTSKPVPTNVQVDLTIKQINGTARAYPWKNYQYT